jgi:hypothetical protein
MMKCGVETYATPATWALAPAKSAPSATTTVENCILTRRFFVCLRLIRMSVGFESRVMLVLCVGGGRVRK